MGGEHDTRGHFQAVFGCEGVIVVGGDWYGRPANSGRHLRQFRVQRLSGNWGRIWTRCRSVRRTREWTVQEKTLRIIPRDVASESWLQEQLPKQLTKRLVRRQCSQSLESGCYEKETISIYHRTFDSVKHTSTTRISADPEFKRS